MYKSLALFAFLFTSMISSAGGGWTPKKGEGFFMTSYRGISGGFLANSQAAFGNSPLASVRTLDLYGEYGIFNRFGVILYSPIFTSVSQAAGMDDFGTYHLEDQASGLGDIDLALKYQIIDSKIALSASLWAGINSGKYNAGNTGRLHLGDGEFNQMARLDLSSSFKSFHWNIYAGFNNRTNNFSDEIQFGGEFGWKKNKFLAILKIDSKNSLFNGTAPDSYSPGIYSNNLEYFGISPQVLYTLKNNVGVMAQAGFALHARNIIAAPSLSVGVFYDLKKKK